jgi:hypothetical protein
MVKWYPGPIKNKQKKIGEGGTPPLPADRKPRAGFAHRKQEVSSSGPALELEGALYF